MNCIYRVVWNRALGLPQVASELTRSRRVASSAGRARVEPGLRWLAPLMLSAAVASPAAWGACGAADIPYCSAPGGAGIAQRTGSGGAGNGSGGGASVFDAGSGTTVTTTGSPAAADGTGGNGVAGDNPGGTGGAVGASNSGTLSVTTVIVGGPGAGGPNGFNFASGGGGGGAGLAFSGVPLIVDTSGVVVGGTGGNGGDGTSPGNQSNGAGGGGGGAGVLATADLADIQVAGQVIGGSGGAGGGGGNNGGGGAGGDGLLVLGQDTAVLNIGAIAGGASAPAGIAVSGNTALGGTGGAGVNLVGQGAALMNDGSITGGAGAIGGQGGTAVVAWGANAIVNGPDGSISGGLQPDGSTALAIQFHGTGHLLTLFAGGTITGGIDLTAGAQTLVTAQNPNLVVDNAITLGAGAVLTGNVGDVNSADGLQFSGPISGSGALSATGPGTLILTGTGTYTGGTTIGAGTTLQIGNGGTTGSLTGDVANAGTLRFDRMDTVSLSGVVSGNGNLIQSGTGTLVLSGIHTYTGATTIQAGTLALVGSGSIAASSGVAVNGTLDISGTGDGASVQAISGAGNIQLGGKTLTLTHASGSFDGTIGGSGGLSVAGGTQVLTGAQAYTGTTGIALGATLALSGAGGIGASQLVSTDGTLDISGTLAGADLQSLTGAGSVMLGTKDVRLTQAHSLFSGGLSGSGGVAVAGGAQGLSGINAYTGLTTIGSTATLALTGSGSIATSSGLVDDGTFDIAGAAGSVTVATLSGHGAVVLGMNDLHLATATGTFAGSLSGQGGLALAGGSLVLSGTNAYAGLTTVSSGATLALTGTGSIAGSAGVALNGGGLDIAGTGHGASITQLSGNGQVTLGAQTLTLTHGGGTYAGVLSGTGGLIVSGGAQALANVQAYSGSTTIGSGAALALTGAGDISASSGLTDNGTFDISGTNNGASVQALSGSGAVNLGTRTLTLTHASGTYDGVLSGAGGLAIAGGTQSLTGVQTYAGSTYVAGTLALMGNGSVAASSGIALAGGTLDISATQAGASIAGLTGSGLVNLGSQSLILTQAQGAFGGVIAGSGGLTINGGTQTLTGANTYTGGTSINGGTLALAGGGSLAPAMSVALNGSGATFDISAAGPQTLASLMGVTGSRVAIGGSALSLAGGTFGGAFTGSGSLNKQGGATLLLTGDSSAFTGTTQVTAGTLAIGDVNSPGAVLGGDVSVGPQGRLQGHGSIGGSVANSGIVAPGGSIGTLTLHGDYTQAANAALSIEVSPTDASLLKVGGHASLDGTLAVTYDPGTYTARPYTFLTAGGGVSGTFAKVTSNYAQGAALGALTPSLAYGGNQVGLTLALPPAPLTPDGPVVVAPTQTSLYAALGTAALLRAQSADAALLGRLASNGGPVVGGGLWADAGGAGTDVDGLRGRPGFHMNQYGVTVGLDRPVGDAVLGVAAGFTHSFLRENATGDTARTDTARLTVYGAGAFGGVHLSGAVGYAFDDLSQKRSFAGIGVAEGSHTGHEVHAALQAAMPIAIDGGTLTPSVGLRYAYFHGHAFGEDGARGQNLRVSADSARSLQPYVGLAFDRSFDNGGKPLDLQLRAGYATETAGRHRGVTVAAQDGTLFAAPGTDLPRSYATAGASLVMHPTKASTLSLNYDALIPVGHASARAASITFRYQF